EDRRCVAQRCKSLIVVVRRRGSVRSRASEHCAGEHRGDPQGRGRERLRHMMLVLACACVVAAAVAYLSARCVVIPLLDRRGVLDQPTARSSHDRPIARGGGIAVLAGLAAGYGAAILAHTVSVPQMEPGAGLIRAALPIAAAFLFGLVGLIDDLNSLSAASRLVTQVVLAGAFSVAALMMSGVGVFAIVAVVASIIIVVNGTNFMDGLNTLV